MLSKTQKINQVTIISTTSTTFHQLSILSRISESDGLSALSGNINTNKKVMSTQILELARMLWIFKKLENNFLWQYI